MIKLVIFDLDGVLVDACEWHKNALNEALKDVCGYIISEEDHINIFNGTPTKVKLKILTEGLKVLDKKDHELVYNLKQSKTIDMIKRYAPIREEKIFMLKKLKSDGFIIGCFTNSIRETAILMLEKTGILDLMDMIVTNQDVVVPKPSPEGYNKIIDKYGAKKENTYIIEDSPKGLESAYAAGCNVIEVKNPDEVHYHKLKEFLK